MIRDDSSFSAALPVLLPTWTINSFSRYDPTSAAGVTGGGRAFTLTGSLATGLLTLTIAGVAKTRPLDQATLYDGRAFVALLGQLWLDFPANQR